MSEAVQHAIAAGDAAPRERADRRATGTRSSNAAGSRPWRRGWRRSATRTSKSDAGPVPHEGVDRGEHRRPARGRELDRRGRAGGGGVRLAGGRVGRRGAAGDPPLHGRRRGRRRRGGPAAPSTGDRPRGARWAAPCSASRCSGPAARRRRHASSSRLRSRPRSRPATTCSVIHATSALATIRLELRAPVDAAGVLAERALARAHRGEPRRALGDHPPVARREGPGARAQGQARRGARGRRPERRAVHARGRGGRDRRPASVAGGDPPAPGRARGCRRRAARGPHRRRGTAGGPASSPTCSTRTERRLRPGPASWRERSCRRSDRARARPCCGCSPASCRSGRSRTPLYVSINTVKSHVKGIYRKLGVDTRARRP